VKHDHIRLVQIPAGLVVALILFTGASWAGTPGEKVLYAFQEGGTDGFEPQGGLIFDASGNLYGTTTVGGGPAEGGTVFELTPTANGWVETVLYSFQGGTDGDYPNASLVMDGAGNLYGTTLYGGTGPCAVSGCGTVFELMPPVNGGPWTESILYSFQDGADGTFPSAGVILDKFGNVYGTTGNGGDLAECSGQGCGTVFELSAVSGVWAETTLYSFQGYPQDGATPKGLTMDSHGNLYGATTWGGVEDIGTIYELSPFDGTWSEKILYTFPAGEVRGHGLQGSNPDSTLVFNSKGDLFGTAQGGNQDGCCGVVFALTPSSGGNWNESVYRFSSENGAASAGTLLFDAEGNLYGTSPSSGSFRQGTAYRLKLGPGRHVTEALYSFCSHTGCPNGSVPESGLILDGHGNLYGTTAEGGLGWGVVYEITP
jgi:uncharacterized repeat protein (TIGR03803 family)